MENSYLELSSVLADICNGRTSSRELLSSLRLNAHRCKQAAFVEVALDWLKIAARDYSEGNFDTRNEREFARAAELMRAAEQAELTF